MEDFNHYIHSLLFFEGMKSPVFDESVPMIPPPSPNIIATGQRYKRIMPHTYIYI